MQELKPGQNLAGPALFRGRLRAFGKCTNIKHRSKRGNKSKQVSFTATAQHRAGFEPCDERRLAKQKSPVLTAQTTQPAYKNWPRGELWRFYPTRIQIRLRGAHYAVTPLWEPTNIATRRRKERRREEKLKTERGGRDFMDTINIKHRSKLGHKFHASF